MKADIGWYHRRRGLKSMRDTRPIPELRFAGDAERERIEREAKREAKRVEQEAKRAEQEARRRLYEMETGY